jgi:outer membrane protein W
MRNATSHLLLVSLLLSGSVSTWAQASANGPRYELGAGIVGSFYDQTTFTSPAGSADAGFDSGFGASAWIGHHMYSRVSGEIRYDYLKNDLTLKGAGASVSFGAESHAIHYDLHFHFTNRQAKIRPYVLVGGGVKLYRGTGEERAFQALSQIAVLTQTTETTGLMAFGAGLKMQLSDAVSLRLEFRDHLTRFPKKLITPNRSTGGDGWINNFAPTAGLSVLF